jgi:antitoxin (DNA-binding transcriptional repressor) of toxin-antitoxin stability system
MTLSTDDLPEALQKLFLEIEQTSQPVTVTHQGKAIVVISPVKPVKSRPGPGVMKGQGEILGDIISPIEQPWEVLQ